MFIRHSPANVDDRSGDTVTMDAVHHMIHEGLMYTSVYLSLSITDDSSIVVLVRTGATQSAHARITAGSGGDATLEVFENPTITLDGSAVDVWNRNRYSSNTAATEVYSGPTVSDFGTSIYYGLMVGGTGGQAAGSTGSGFDEWILKANEEYVFRLTNKSGQAHSGFIELNFYEPQ